MQNFNGKKRISEERSAWCKRASTRSKPTGFRDLRVEPLEERLALNGGSLMINEFGAINNGTLQDEDGDYSDWIEIHNSADVALSLDGWYLTDEEGTPTKWRFPAVSLAADGYVVVFASDKDRADPASELHTNFKLTGDGEYLALVEPNGTTIAHEYAPKFAEQVEDVSYGLSAPALVGDSLVGENAPVKVLVPDNDSLGFAWTDVSFDDLTWTGSFSGVGYERDPDGLYGELIETNLEADMYDQWTSAYIRAPFEVTDLAEISSLTFGVRFDDGYVAYLNGVEIARQNADDPLSYDSSASGGHADAEAIAIEYIDISAFLGELLVGTNVLAIHGLNVAANSSDFLIAPELLANVEMLHQERYFATPTPGAANVGDSLGVLSAPRFSVDRGFYDSPFSVEITAESVGARIRYTLDGSEPTATAGHAYEAPIFVDGTSTLRAIAWRPGYLSDGVETCSYIFVDDVLQQSPYGAAPGPGWPSSSVNGQILDYGMDPSIVNDPLWGPQLEDALKAIPSISLVTDLDNLFASSDGIYVNAENNGHSWERPASVELIYPDGTEGFQVDAGVRIRGGHSRDDANPKHAFRLFFRDEYGDAKLEYPLFGDEGAQQFDKIDLRTGQSYSWAYDAWSLSGPNSTLIRDVFSRESQGEMGQPYTRSRYYHLYIDGHYWGLYQTQERSEAAFGKSYFGGEREDYDVIKVSRDASYSIVATDGNLDAWRDLWNQARAGFASDTAYYRAQGLNLNGTRNSSYPVLLDVDNLIDYLLIIYYSGNRDAPVSYFIDNLRGNNWYGVRDRNGDVGFKFFVHDAEHTLLTEYSSVDRTGPFTAGDTFNYSNPQWIHQQLMANAEYRLRFADRVRKHLMNGGLLTPGPATERFLALAEEIELAIIAESARWGDSKKSSPYTKDDWLKSNAGTTDEFMINRNPIVLDQLRDATLPSGGRAPLYPDVDAPSFNQHGGRISAGFNLALHEPSSGTVYVSLDGTDPRLAGGGISPTALPYTFSSLGTTTLIEEGAIWKYLDDGSNQGTAWREPGFNDNLWTSGPAELGYGDGDEQTVVSYGPNAADKHVTTYFRHTFHAADTSDIALLTLRLTRDDGVIVYLNGEEIVRDNMSYRPVTHRTLAVNSVGGDDETTALTFSVNPALLVEGDNVLAVEIHQSDSSSSDLSFDLQFAAERGFGVELNEGTVVKARTYAGGQWSALNEAAFTIGEPAAADNLIVSEINFNPYDPTDDELAINPQWTAGDFEFIEFMNVGSHIVDLSGIEFVAGVDFEFGGIVLPPTVPELAPGERIVLVRDPAAFATRYGNLGVTPGGQYQNALGDGGERLRLLSADGEDIFHFEYDDNSGRADGKGAALELIDPMAVPHDDPQRTAFLEDDANWRPSIAYGGTPGGDPEAGLGIVINEVLSHTDSSLTDSIELHNVGGVAVDVGGWYLSDSWGWDPTFENGNYQKYRIPTGVPAETVIAPGGYLVFDEGDFNPTPGNPAANHFALDGTHGDDVWLMKADAAGQLTHFGDHVEFLAAPLGESFGRWPNGTGKLYPMSGRTLGDANNGPRVGPVIITEVQYYAGLFHENFQEGAERFAVAAGDWAVADGRFRATPASLGEDTVATINLAATLQTDYVLEAKVTAGATIGGFAANAVLLFDYHGPDDFKYAGVFVDENQYRIGRRDAGGWSVDAFRDALLLPGKEYGLKLSVEGPVANLSVEDDEVVSFVFGESLDDGLLGVGTANATSWFDAVAVEPLADGDLEYVELCNPTDQWIQLAELLDGPGMPTQYLADWRLRQGIDMEFDPGTTIAPWGTLVVLSFDPIKAENADRVAAFRDFYGISGAVPLAGGYDGSLSNGGERVQLQSPGVPPADEPDFVPHYLEDEVDYDDDWPWPANADGNGLSLHRLSPEVFGNEASHWVAGTPSPGSVPFFTTDPAVLGRHDMTLVHDSPSFDDQATGERSLLPESLEWIDEWDSFWVEIWVSTPDTDDLGVLSAQVDLTYNTDYFTATDIDYGPGFTVNQTGTIDDATGVVDNLGARASAVHVGDDQHALLARVRFEATVDDPGVPLGAAREYITPVDHEFALEDAQVTLVGNIAADVEPGDRPDTELWPVMYDLDDSGVLDYGDVGLLAETFQDRVEESPFDFARHADFDHSGVIDYADVGSFADNFRRSRESDQSLIYPDTFPDSWRGQPLLFANIEVASNSTVENRNATITTPISLTGDGATSQVKSVAEAAKRRLSDVLDTGVERLASVDVRITDLPDLELGRTVGDTIYLDADAAGYGWFIDATPGDDLEFSRRAGTNELLATLDSPARGRVDLLTTLMHEFGHVLGYEHSSEGDAMHATLPLSTRRLLSEDLLFASSDEEDADDFWGDQGLHAEVLDEVFRRLGT